MATAEPPGDSDFAHALRTRMKSMELTIAQLASRSGVRGRTIQGWLTEGRRPRPIPLGKVENIVGPLDAPSGLDPARPPSIGEALKRLRAAERSLAEAKAILNQLDT